MNTGHAAMNTPSLSNYVITRRMIAFQIKKLEWYHLKTTDRKVFALILILNMKRVGRKVCEIVCPEDIVK